VGGDHAGGLAIAIFIAMVCMVAVPLLALSALGALVGGLVGRWAGFRPSVAGLVTGLSGAALGGGMGTLLVFATFFESSWNPPPRLMFDVPPGYAHETVVLLEDGRSSHEISWQGLDLPFLAPYAEIDVPVGGVVRVRSLEDVDRVEGYLPDGRYDLGFSSMPAPMGSDASLMLVFGFATWPGTEPDLGMMPPDQLLHTLRSREAER
jgi:hypothetical protein